MSENEVSEVESIDLGEGRERGNLKCVQVAAVKVLLHATQVMASWVEQRMTSGAALLSWHEKAALLSGHEKEDWKPRRRGVGAKCWDNLWEGSL